MFTLCRISVADRRYGHHYSSHRSDYKAGVTAGAVIEPAFLTGGCVVHAGMPSKRHTSSLCCRYHRYHHCTHKGGDGDGAQFAAVPGGRLEWRAYPSTGIMEADGGH